MLGNQKEIVYQQTIQNIKRMWLDKKKKKETLFRKRFKLAAQQCVPHWVSMLLEVHVSPFIENIMISHMWSTTFHLPQTGGC